MVFGLSSLLLIGKNDMPPELGKKLPQIIDITAKVVIYMNLEEDYEDEEESNDEDEEEVEVEEESKEEEGSDSESGDGLEKESNRSNTNELVDGSDIKYIQNCCDIENNPQWMMQLLDDWEHN